MSVGVLQQTSKYIYIQYVSKNVPPSTCHNFYIHSSIVTIFGINVAEKVANQNVLYFPTSRTSASAVPGERGNPEAVFGPSFGRV